MAVLLQLTYSKKLGLPNYSSHSCSASMTVEITDPSLAAQETGKLYQLLQATVDNEIKQVGFMPDATTYGMNNGNGRSQSNGSGHSTSAHQTNGHTANGHGNGSGNGNEPWKCTEGQQGLILRLVNEGNFTKQEVEALAQQLFSTGVKTLDKLQASQLIEELLEKCDKKTNGRRPRWQNSQRARS